MMFLTVEAVDLGRGEGIFWIFYAEEDLDVVSCESTFFVVWYDRAVFEFFPEGLVPDVPSVEEEWRWREC